MRQRKVNLDSYEEELAACEQGIGGALKEARDAVAAAEPAQKELEMKVAQLGMEDPGDGNLQPIVFRGHVTPIAATCYWGLAPGGKRLRR